MQRVWMREVAGWLAAAAIALIVAAQVASSPRGELLFRDGDSLVVALFTRSWSAGDPLEWAMSSVLFLPESAVFAVLDLLPAVDVNGVLAVNAVVNLLALYGALRLTAGRHRPGRAPIAWAVVAIGAFAAPAVTEQSSSRDALELASLQTTTTYYSATVVAVVLTIGVLRRSLDSDRRGVGAAVALVILAAASTLSNPLYAVWATVPLAVILVAAAVRARRRGRSVALLAALVGGTATGFALRIPFGAWIANTGAGYAQPSRWIESLGYYAALFADRLTAPLGLVGCLVTAGLLVLAVVRSVRSDDAASRLVALAAWVTPVLVVLGAVALGTHAARYLQPVAFAPVLALVAAPRSLALPARMGRQVAAVAGVLVLVGSAVSVPRLAAAASAPDPDLTCVTDWVAASGRTGAGQFWTVRLPKLHVPDPSRLVQVDHQLRGYAWLVNRSDFAAEEVSFLVEDAQTVAWQLPVSAIPETIVDCGRYRILDFGSQSLPLGPQRS